MDAATRNARADRLQRLWRHACGNFRGALARYEIADAARDQAPPASPKKREAAEECRRALQSMNHWNRRSAALARAEIATVLGNNHA